MLGICSQNMQFIYVLPNWEGSITYGKVLCDAVNWRNGLKIPHGRMNIFQLLHLNSLMFNNTYIQ